MIDVCYAINVEAEKCRIEAHGHAGCAERGGDVICAGVSALLYGFLYYLSEKHGSSLVWRESGDSLFMCFPSDSAEALEVVTASLRLMADTYPEYVSLQEGR
ncbi:MAG: ribosomal-processing cysteine protease Prp [Ruminococcaceae bacterium]|nr:ribosomal-processing cysteine protease Prp [Oscillospiraceae bacterium]